MRLFITASFKAGENRKEIEKLCRIVNQAGFQDFCFIRDVENYQYVFDDDHELMERAKQEIIHSDVLLIDLSEKSTGRAIEAGIAFGHGKKVVVICKRGTKLKSTSKGIAAAIIEYNVIDDISKPLSELSLSWKQEK